MASSGTRLRKTFQYPSDSESSTGSRDELDEEEQDKLISTLHQQNAHKNALYTLIFTLLPLILTPPFFIFTFPFSPLLTILGITSLFTSAGRMRFVSPAPPPPRPSTQPDRLSRWLQLTKLEQQLLDAVPEDGPLRVALPWLNVAICALLGVAALLLYRKGDEDATWLFCLLPGMAWAMVEVALRSMREVETGVGELKRLRYRYKGA